MPRRKKDPKATLEVTTSTSTVAPVSVENGSSTYDSSPTASAGSTIIIVPIDHPRLNEWVESYMQPEDIKFAYVNDVVRAKFSEFIEGGEHVKFETFKINKNHYKARMNDVCHHINYYIKFYDRDSKFMISMASMKYMVDRFTDLSVESFKNLLLTRVITPQFVSQVKQMAFDLYTVNINTDNEGKYRSTPKITNEEAKLILAVSFAYRLILPLCVHFSNVNDNIIASSDYIKAFDSIFMEVMALFETEDTKIFYPICKFINYRLERVYKMDSLIWNKKKQLYGITFEYEFQYLIHDVILVKSLYKIAYDRSVVSYIDGVFTNSYNHFRFENFKFKPIEIEADSGGSDSDDYLTHAESLEMTIYRIDESNQLINDVNNELVLQEIYERFAIPISDEEFNFYMEHCCLNNLTQHFLHTFFSSFFHSSTAIQTITKRDTIHLLIILKKYLQVCGMVLLPQLVSSVVRGRFRENMIKNTKFMEKLESSSVYRQVIVPKYRPLFAITPKENPIVKKLSTIINSTFMLVDPDPAIDGRILENVPIDTIVDEYLTFLSIC